MTMNRFGQKRVNRFLFDFLVDKAGPDEDCDEHSEDGNGGQAQIQNYLVLIPERQLSESDRAQDENQSKKDQVIENLVRMLSRKVLCAIASIRLIGPLYRAPQAVPARLPSAFPCRLFAACSCADC